MRGVRGAGGQTSQLRQIYSRGEAWTVYLTNSPFPSLPFFSLPFSSLPFPSLPFLLSHSFYLLRLFFFSFYSFFPLVLLRLVVNRVSFGVLSVFVSCL